MNLDTVSRLARTLLQVAGAFVVGKFGIDAGSWESISGALVVIVTTGFTVWAAQKAAK